MFGFPSVTVVAIIGAFAMGAIGAGWTVHKIELSNYQALELKYKDAEIAAANQAREEQKALDNVAINAAKRQAATQAALTAKAKRQLSEVSKYVKERPNSCVTVGLVRVLDAAVHGVLAGSLAIPPGVSDDSCSGIDAPTLARSIIDNYNTANANKEQLNGLIKVLREMEAQHSKDTKKKP